MEVGILALQGDVSEHESALADIGVSSRRILLPGDLKGIDGIVLPGGESTTLSMLLESSGLFDPLAEQFADGLPAFGTCAGMILLASSVVDGRDDQRSFAAIDVGVRRNAFGTQAASFECDLVVSGFEGCPLHAIFIRAPQVERVGDEVEVLAALVPSNDEGTGVRPVLCRQGAVLVAAFHPELTGDRRLHRLFVDTIEERGR
jgi:5'-phosphate synthase pdxT subunit